MEQGARSLWACGHSGSRAIPSRLHYSSSGGVCGGERGRVESQERGDRGGSDWRWDTRVPVLAPPETGATFRAMNSTSLRCAALLALVPALPLAAQEHEHGFAEQVGHVTFPVSCNAEARRHFEHGMALLHSFWWDQASAAFRAVIAADSTCAMAYWGLALNSWGNPFAGGPTGDNLQQGKAAAERAMALGAPTVRERGLLA